MSIVGEHYMIWHRGRNHVAKVIEVIKEKRWEYSCLVEFDSIQKIKPIYKTQANYPIKKER